MEKVLVEKYGFETGLDLPELNFRSVREAPFDLYGLYDPKAGGTFRRVPEDVAAATSSGVKWLAENTAGGRIRFQTDSEYVAIHAVMSHQYRPDHFALTGATGFDLYIRQGAKYRYYGTFRPGYNEHGYEQVIRFRTREMRDIMIHFPLYNAVRELYIGLHKEAVVDHGSRYRFDKPVVYYGSSITQGGCVCRPGNSYESIISIDLDCDFINLGFSGNAKGEEAIRSYIASLDMSVFVLDYDHNAPTDEHLSATHEPLFRCVREAHPTLPIILVTRPDTNMYAFGGTWIDNRRTIVHDTYRHAIEAGDQNVYFIDGDSLFAGPHRDLCTVDGCHPNDAGHIRMADVIGSYVAAVLR